MPPKRLYTLILAILLIATITAANAQNAIRVIYFQPANVPAPTAAELKRIRDVVADTQEFYRAEMQQHGYDKKSFQIETENDAIRVHAVQGKRNLNVYTNSAIIDQELPPDLRNPFDLKNNIRVIFLGGSKLLGNGAVTHILCRDDQCAYTALIPAKSGDLMPHFTAHEIGHAFGLQHNPNLGHQDNYVMQSLVFVNNVPKLENSSLDDYETHWLDKHKFFNGLDVANKPPTILETHEPTSTIIDGKQHIQIQIDVGNTTPLHQSQISKSISLRVLAWKELKNRNETVQFEIRRNDLLGVKNLIFQVIDTNGNTTHHNMPFILPKKAEKPEPIEIAEEPRTVSPIHRLPTRWAKLKTQ